MTPEEVSNMEQASADVRDHFIPLLKSFYDGCIKEGFNDFQTLSLTNTYMKTILGSTQGKQEE